MISKLNSISAVPGSPCEHDGVCVNTPGSYRCDCAPGFAGPRCEVNVNECDSSPCMNDGTCIDGRGGFKCICMPGKNKTFVSDVNIEVHKVQIYHC